MIYLLLPLLVITKFYLPNIIIIHIDELDPVSSPKKASNILKNALRHLKGRRQSFLCGDPGPLALAAVLHHREGDDDMANDCIARCVFVCVCV